MKGLLAASAIAISVLVTPAGATTLAVWEGFVYVKTATSACTDQTGPGGGFNTGFFASALHAVFKPAGVVDNGPDSKLLLITNRSALHHIWAGKPFGVGNIPGTGFGGTANIFTWNSKFTSATISPPAPTASTQTVVLNAKIATFFGVAGCTVTVSGSLSHRPNLSY
jgi:hypothetical protein